MSVLEIKIIPEHIAYTVEYDTAGEYDFFDFETGDNTLQDLEDLVLSENPGVTVPEIPDDYNYTTYPAGVIPSGKMRVSYYDMVNKMGKDNPDGKYRFVTVPEVKAAVMYHKGKNEGIDEERCVLNCELYPKMIELIVDLPELAVSIAEGKKYKGK